MQNQTLLTILVAGTASILASVAVSLSLAPTQPSGHELLAATPETSPVDASLVTREDLEQELDSLRAENLMLTSRLTKLEEARVWAESRRQVVEPTAKADDRSEEERIKDGLAALTNPDGTLPSNAEEVMRRAFEDFREAEREESEQRWEDARKKELDARIERYVTELGLDSFQADEMRSLLDDEQVRRGELMTAARETGGWDTLREDMRAIRDETREGLELVLTPDQMDKYEQSSRRGGFGGGRGGPDGGGGGGRRGDR